MQQPKIRIRTKLSILFSALFGAVSLFIVLYFPAQHEKHLMRGIAARAKSIVSMTAMSLGPAVVFEDKKGIDDAFGAARQNKDLAFIVVHDESGRLVAALDSALALSSDYRDADQGSRVSRDGSVFLAMAPIMNGGRPIGVVYLGLTLEEVKAETRESMVIILLLAGAIWLFGILVSFSSSAFITAPLAEMVETVSRISAGDWTMRAKVSAGDETDDLARAFNVMVDKVQSAQRELMQVNQELERRVEVRTRELLQEVLERSKIEKENTLLAYALRSTSEYVSITDTDDRLIFVNDSFVRAYGYSREELLGAHIRMVQSDKNPPELLETIFSRTIAGGWSGELINRRKDGSEFPIHLSTSVLRDADGQIAGLIGVAADITERCRAEQALVQARDFYLTLFEEFPTLIWRARLDGARDYFNRTWLTFTGRSLEQELGTGWLEGIHPEDADGSARIERQAVQERRRYEVEYRLRRADGAYRWIVSIGQPFYSIEGELDGYIGTCYDVTDLKLATESLRKLSQAVDQSGEIIFMTDSEGLITYANPAFERTYGFTLSEARGRKPSLLKSGLMSDEFYRQLWSDLHAGRSVRSEFTNRAKDGRIVIVDAHLSPVFDEKGAISGYIAVQTDVTQRRKETEERRALELQLIQAQKMEALGTLAGGIAHDFNNILGIILGYAMLLETAKDGAEQRKQAIDAILKASERGAGLVRQILTFARRTEVNITPLSVNSVVGEVAKLLGETFPRTVTLSLQLEKALPIIQMDQNQLHQALLNLCINARDAMNDNGVITITTRLVPGEQLAGRFPEAARHDYVEIRVSDNGSGIDPATKERIFEPFFTTKPQGKGTGLGLAVVYGIIQTHRGFVDVETEAGRGSTFTLYLPAAQKVVLGGSRSGTPDMDARGGSETILFVEDEEMLRELGKTTLESRGYTVIEAADGQEAVELFHRHNGHIDLVVADVGLPRMGGLEACRQMRASDPALKIVLASGYLDPQTKSELNKLGVNIFIQKPYTLQEFLRKVREALDGVLEPQDT